MEENERKHILANLDLLVESTTCNPSLVTFLMEKRVLSDGDVYVLDAVRNKLKRSFQFYRIVETRWKSYPVLIEALKHSGQHGPAEILSNLERPHSPSTVSSDIRKRVKRLLQGLEDDDIKPSKIPKESSVWFDVQCAVDLFTGRKRELAELDSKFKSDPNTPTVIAQVTSISGLGGIGKTELARKFLQDNKHNLNNVIWINAEREGYMMESFRRLAKDELGIVTKDANGGEKDIATIVKDVYFYFQDRECTFVFDNAERGDLLTKFLPMNSLPPGVRQPYILITSRDREWPSGTNVINLNELDLEDAVELIRKGLEIQNDSENEAIIELSKLLQCFPLAMHQAISFINSQAEVGIYKISDYIAEFENNREELLSSEISEFFNDYTKTTYTTWKITVGRIAQVENFGELALQILNLVGYFAPDKILRETFSPLVGEGGREERKLKYAVRLLVKYSMLNGENRQSSLSVHRLVQEVTRLNLMAERREEEVLQKTMELLQGNVCQAGIYHSTSAWKHGEKYEQLVTKFRKLPWEILNGLYGMFRFEEALKFGITTGETLARILSPDHFDTLEVHSWIAQSLYGQGKYEESLERSRELLKKQRECLGELDRFTLDTEFNIGQIYFAQTKYPEALECYQSLLDKQLRMEEEDFVKGVKCVKTMNIIACAFCALGKLQEALVVFEKIFTKYGTLIGEGVDVEPLVKVIQSLTNPAIEKVEIKLILRNALEIATKVFDSDSQLVLTTGHNLGFILFMEGKYLEGFELMKEMYEKRKCVLGADHSDTIYSLMIIGKGYLQQKMFQEALQTHIEVYRIYCKIAGENSYSVVLRKRDVGTVLSNGGMYPEALDVFMEVMEDFGKHVGKEHPENLDTMTELGCLHIRMGKFLEAVNVLKEVKVVYDKEGKRDHKYFKIVDVLSFAEKQLSK